MSKIFLKTQITNLEHTYTMQRDYITVGLIRQTFSLMIAYFAHRKIKALQFALEALTGVLDKNFIGWIRDIHPDLFIKSSLDEHRFQCWPDEDRSIRYQNSFKEDEPSYWDRMECLNGLSRTLVCLFKWIELYQT